MSVLMIAFFSGTSAHGERSSPSSGSGRSALALAVVCALTLATAVAVHALVSRRAAKGSASSKKAKVVSVLQRDEELERVAEASAQMFPVGARVKLADSRGDGVVVGYDPVGDSYEVQLLENGKQAVSVRSSELIQPRVADFFIYPIKSCGGIRLESAAITGVLAVWVDLAVYIDSY